MKNRLFISVIIGFIILISCSKEKECDNPVDCLPALTQYGANTAGCLVNGKALVPGGQGINTGSVLQAQYYYSDVDNSLFGLAITNNRSGNKMVLLEIRNQVLKEGKTYELESENSKTFGSYFDGLEGFVTNDDQRGELTVSKIDTDRQIASGTFWFDAINNEGEVVKIRNGRFDVLYYTTH